MNEYEKVRGEGIEPSCRLNISPRVFGNRTRSGIAISLDHSTLSKIIIIILYHCYLYLSTISFKFLFSIAL